MTKTNKPGISAARSPIQTRLKPQYSSFPLIGSPWMEFKERTVTLSRQARDLPGTHIQIFEIDVIRQSRIRFQIRRPTGFLLFMLKGQIRFYPQTENSRRRYESPVHCFCYQPKSTLHMELEKGQHSALVIGLEPEWFVSGIDKQLHQFSPVLKAWSLKTSSPIRLEEKQISESLWNTIHRIRTTRVDDLDQGLGVLQDVARCMARYHQQLADHREQEARAKGKKLHTYLTENFMYDEECRIACILNQLGWSNWTLRRIAKKTFGCSVRAYITRLRMNRAVDLLVNTDLFIQEIAIRVGYSSPIVFIKAFRKDRGISPNAYRKTRRK